MSLLSTTLSEQIGDDLALIVEPQKGKGRPKKVPEKNKVIAACTGAIITSLTMTPFDVVKTRLQTQGPSAQAAYYVPPSSSNSPWPPPVASTSTSPFLGAAPSPSVTSSASPASKLLACCQGQSKMFTASTDSGALICKFDPRVSTHSLPSSGTHLISPATPARNITTGLRPLLGSTLAHSPSPSCLYASPSGAILTLPHAPPAHLTGFWDAVIKIVRHEGIAAMWRGTGPALAMSVPGQVTYMLGYDLGRRTAFDHAPGWAYVPTSTVAGLRTEEPKLRASYVTVIPLLAGSASRTFVAILVSPLELLRTRLQSSPSSTTVRTILMSMRNDSGGWRSGWRGLAPTLWRDVPFSGIYWAGYEAFKRALTGGKGLGEGWEGHGLGEEVGVAFVAGGGSGMVAAMLTNPFDVVKTRRQAIVPGSASSTKAQTKTFNIIFEIAKNEGRAGLFRGLGPRLAKVGPACGIMIASYEGLSRILD